MFTTTIVHSPNVLCDQSVNAVYRSVQFCALLRLGSTYYQCSWVGRMVTDVVKSSSDKIASDRHAV